MDRLSDKQWAEYEEQGYLRLGNVVDEDTLRALQTRIDDIMMGRAAIDYDRLLMQLDSASGKYEEAGEQSRGHKGATLNYRKIQDLEFDPVFLAYMQRPIFESICRRVYGDIDIGCFRAMFMNKPAGRGTWLPWHQDRWNYLDRDPLLTVYTALDPATRENGCVQIIPGSHKLGVINPEHTSGFLSDEQALAHCGADKVIHVELAAGEVALLHNWLLHASDVNRSKQSRRAFSVCYMDARTVNKRSGDLESRSVIFGEGALSQSALNQVEA